VLLPQRHPRQPGRVAFFGGERMIFQKKRLLTKFTVAML
jgi:hypothetical protein